MENQDIRWKQRFMNYEKALSQLTKFIERGKLNELEEQGLIKSFEYTYELGWNVMKDYLNYQGDLKIMGSRDAIRLSFNRGLLDDGEQWMKMVEDRIKSAHTYNEDMADDVAYRIIHQYYNLFINFKIKMKTLL